MNTMNTTARITVLVENSVKGRGLLAEHGLALWIEIGGRRLLFDTGQGAVLLRNARRLGVPLEQAEAVILSHGHYDHTGGLTDVLRAAPRIQIYAHPAALEPKYGRNDDGTSRAIGIPSPAEHAVRAHTGDLRRTERPTEVHPGVFATGEIPRRTEYEDTGGPFFTDSACQKADPLVDDQALFFDSPRGTIVLLGCAHAGVINTLQYIRELTNGRSIHAVLGGMHLGAASRERMDRTIADLRKLDIERLGPAHCTGFAATAELWNEFPESRVPCPVGTSLEFAL